jgi:dihydrofolate reductase
MITSLVVAASSNNVIGKDNKLLWHLPNDLKFFKNTTWAMPVVMGRKTFEAVGKPLTGRTNIILTRKKEWRAPGVTVVQTLKDATDAATATDAKEMFIIGGGEIYRETLMNANKVYLTRVHAHLAGDTFFPELPESQWRLFSNLDFPADAKHAFPYSFQLWVRK